MVNSITPISSPSFSTPPTEAELASEGLELLLYDPGLLDALASRSSKYVPPSGAVILAALWGLINTNGSVVITQEDVQKAVIAGGGDTNTADAFWAQMNPNKNDTISAGDFASNKYLVKALAEKSETFYAKIEETRQEQQRTSATSNTLLDHFGSGMSSILDLFI